MSEKNVFLTNDIVLEDVDLSENFERYDLTIDYDNFLDYCENTEEWHEDIKAEVMQRIEEIKKLNEPKTSEQFYNEVVEFSKDYADTFETWQDNAEHDEVYQTPMMYAVRFFPNFITFEMHELYKVAGATCLIYDNELER